MIWPAKMESWEMLAELWIEKGLGYERDLC